MHDLGSILFLLSSLFLFAFIFLSRLKFLLYSSLQKAIVCLCLVVRFGYSLVTKSRNSTRPDCFLSRKLNKLAAILFIWLYFSWLKESIKSSIVIYFFPIDNKSKYSLNSKTSFLVIVLPLMIIMF